MKNTIHVGLFVTCLVDLFRPSVGFASIKLLEDAGCHVHVPISQTCCGLMAWNGDDKPDAQEMALEVVKNFESFDYIIAPSEPCAKMLKDNYPKLFEKDPTWKEQVQGFSSKVYELTAFLSEVLKIDHYTEPLQGTVVGKDLGELLDKASKLKRQGKSIEVRHIAEVMADMTGTPAIGAN